MSINYGRAAARGVAASALGTVAMDLFPLGRRYDLSPGDAYLLRSLVVDLAISQIVDGGQYIVSALLPKAIFS